MQKAIIVRNDVSDESLMHFYKACEVFVYPSKAEGFGIPPLEAAALRVPVLCSNTSAMSDFTFFGRFHFNPNDQSEFNLKLNEIITDPPGTEELARVAEIISGRYSWQRSAETLYNEVVNDYTRKKELSRAVTTNKN